MRNIIKEYQMEEVTELDYIQYLSFCKSSYEDILKDILINKHNEYKYTEKNYEYFMNEYRNAEIKFHFAYLEYLANIEPEYSGDDNFYIEFDFLDRYVRILKKDLTEKDLFYARENAITIISIKDDSELNYFRSLQADYDAYVNIIKNVINTKESCYNFNIDLYNKFITDYQKVKNDYNEMFYMYIDKHAPDYNNPKYSAKIDYNNKELLIYKK